MRMIVGTNVAESCDTALILNGLEVFRLREGEDGAWLCDFEVADKTGRRLAKIVKNQVVHAAEGYRYEARPEGGVLRDPAGSTIASALWQGDALVVTGQFFHNGIFATATDTELTVNGFTARRNRVSSKGAAVVITSDGFGLGAP